MFPSFPASEEGVVQMMKNLFLVVEPEEETDEPQKAKEEAPSNIETVKAPRPIVRLVVEEEVFQTDSVLDVVRKNKPYSWERIFDEAVNELRDINSVLMQKDKEGGWYPLRCDLFNAFHFTPINRVRVVIIGQDPYHDFVHSVGAPRAMGLSFSVRPGVPVPPSLRNIYKEVQSCYPSFRIPSHGDLTAWTEQGVLLLNTCLTVQPGQAGSHQEI